MCRTRVCPTVQLHAVPGQLLLQALTSLIALRNRSTFGPERFKSILALLHPALGSSLPVRPWFITTCGY